MRMRGPKPKMTVLAKARINLHETRIVGIWSWVLRGPERRMIVLAKSSSILLGQSRPEQHCG
jgi:hypothetical protein